MVIVVLRRRRFRKHGSVGEYIARQVQIPLKNLACGAYQGRLRNLGRLALAQNGHFYVNLPSRMQNGQQAFATGTVCAACYRT